MKYDRQRMIKRNKEILKYYEDRPDMTLKQIGKLFNMTASRVHFIVTRTRDLEAQRKAEKGE